MTIQVRSSMRQCVKACVRGAMEVWAAEREEYERGSGSSIMCNVSYSSETSEGRGFRADGDRGHFSDRRSADPTEPASHKTRAPMD